MLTLREIYDQTVAHLKSMPGPCAVPVEPEPGQVRAHPRCLYRREDGAACAVGYWIPEERYSPSFEGVSLGALSNPATSVEQRLRFNALLSALPTMPNGGLQLLRRLQQAHDQVAHNMGTWDEEVLEEDLANIRREFSL